MAVRAMTNRSRLLISLFALLGLGAASASTWVHYQLVQDASYASFCDVSATVGTSASECVWRHVRRAGGDPRRVVVRRRAPLLGIDRCGLGATTSRLPVCLGHDRSR
jgi:hypothetical protein